MVKKITTFLTKFIKSFSVKACKSSIYNHITGFIFSSSLFTIIASQYFKIKAGIFASCRSEWLGCVTKLSEPLLIIISFSLMWVWLLICKKRFEEKFSPKSHKISEEVKKDIKTVIAKYYRILTSERKFLGHCQAQALHYLKELPGDFNGISQNPEVVEDEDLFLMINNAENRAAVILDMAANVVSDQEQLTGGKMTNHEYLQNVDHIFSQFLEHKREIFQHLKNL